MKILYYYQTLARYGGVERVLADKMNYLSVHYGYDIYMITRDQGTHQIPFPLNEKVHYADLGIRMHTQYAYKGLRRLWEKLKLQIKFEHRIKEKIRAIQPDIIIGTDDMPAGALLRYKGSSKLVIESHTMYYVTSVDGVTNSLKKYLRYKSLSVYRKANVLVSLTHGDAMDWIQKNRNPKVIVIPNVVNLNNTGHFSTYTQKRVIYAGRFAYLKGIPNMIKIWKLVNQKHPDWTLDFYGEGEEKEKYAPLIDSLNINFKVHEPTSDIHKEYCNSSIAILTSISESFALVLPEEMSCGLPVVSFDCPYGPRDIIKDGINGFLIPPNNVELFAEKICLLIENETLREKMGKAGIEYSKRFSAEIVMPQWKNLFENLLRK